MKKVKLKEGIIFSFPMSELFGIGLIVRLSNLNVPFGYFFDKVFPSTPNESDVNLNEVKVVLKSKFGRQGFNDGSWKIIKMLNDFSREKYPLPEFYQKSGLTKEIIYLNDNLQETNRAVAAYDESHYNDLPDIALRGSKVIEIQMLKKVIDK